MCTHGDLSLALSILLLKPPIPSDEDPTFITSVDLSYFLNHCPYIQLHWGAGVGLQHMNWVRAGHSSVRGDLSLHGHTVRTRSQGNSEGDVFPEFKTG